MIGKEIAITSGAGKMDAYVAHPDGEGPFPLVLLFMDVWGLREELFRIVRRVAAEGYYCVVPNLFYRDGKARYEERNADGRMLSFDKIAPAMQVKLRDLSGTVTRARAREDIAAVLEFCRQEPVDPGPAGSVGFCLGGRVIFFAGQEFPARFRANASLHGTRLIADASDSVHRLIGRMRGELYCGYGEHDSLCGPDVAAEIARLCADNPDLRYRGQIHPGAGHGYSLPDRDIYDHKATEADWAAIFAMFGRMLKRHG